MSKDNDAAFKNCRNLNLAIGIRDKDCTCKACLKLWLSDIEKRLDMLEKGEKAVDYEEKESVRG